MFQPNQPVKYIRIDSGIKWSMPAVVLGPAETTRDKWYIEITLANGTKQKLRVAGSRITK